MRKNLKPEDLGDLLDGPTIAVLGTHMKDGHTLLSPVWQEYRDGGFTVVTLADDVKSKRLKRDPMASVLVAEQKTPYRGIEVRGEATVSKAADILDAVGAWPFVTWAKRAAAPRPTRLRASSQK